MQLLKNIGRKYLKLLIGPYYNSLIGVNIRNKLGFNIVPIYLPNNLTSYSVSDAFPWRIDDGYVTHFRYSDLLKQFYNIDGNGFKFVFYNNRGILIKEYTQFEMDLVNELVIDKKFIPGDDKFGNFSIFHLFDPDIENVKILNRCYVGFNKNNAIPSYVHGNIFSRYWNPATNKIETGINKLTKKVHNYYLQKNFKKYEKIELYFTNQTASEYWVEINNEKINLDVGQSKIIVVKPCDIIHIKSNNYWARPIVFVEKNNFIDCFHS